MRITCSCVRPISFLIRELFNLLSDLFFFAQIFKLFPPFLINIICNFLNFFKKNKTTEEKERRQHMKKSRTHNSHIFIYMHMTVYVR